MYEAHFGLKQRPFRDSPEGVCYYPATGHEWVLTRLLQAVKEGEGLALMTGEPGTGKTLLCHRLLEQLGPDFTSAYLTNCHFPDRASLLQAILFDLSLPYEGRREQELRLALTEYLLTRFGGGQRTLVLIDEAHHLAPECLEELRLLGNLEAQSGKAVQVVLVALPCLLETLRRPDLASFRQRLAVRVQLEPLTGQEGPDYLLHHLRAAGGRAERLLSEEALGILCGGAKGIPRLLNQAAHHAFGLAFADCASAVDVEAVVETLEMLGLEAETAEDNEEARTNDESATESEADQTGVLGELLVDGKSVTDEMPKTRAVGKGPHNMFHGARRPA